VKFRTDPKVYAIDTDGTLRWIISEDLALEFYGESWNKKIDEIDDVYFSNYAFGALLDGVYPWDPVSIQESVRYPSDVMSIPGYTVLPDGGDVICEE
jgi:hypothetical protein